MSLARRQQKPWWKLRPAAVVLAVVVIAGISGGGTVWAAITQRIVTNPLTGLAISGFDPVAYFTDHKARLGHASLEYSYGGTIWRFCNIGNRDAFVRYPHVYMPQFGGYDPGALARGVALPGNPLIWLVSGERLYLFSSASARTAFAADPARAITAAERGWQQVKPTLVP